MTASLVTPSHLLAQNYNTRVLRLNREAMQAYTNLEIDQSQALLEQALALTERHPVRDNVAARTQLNMAVIQVGGLQDETQGLQYCIRALRIDPSIKLDPVTSTPEIRTIFDLAKSQIASAGVDNNAPPPDTSAAGNIPHIPVPEQLVHTAVPVFIEVPEDAQVGPIYVHYRSLGMEGYRQLTMERVPGGYGAEIACTDVYEPKVEYYIEAYALDGTLIGFAGTGQEPIEVPIVTERTHPAPGLEGRPVPQQCDVPSCPPGDTDCENTAAGGNLLACESNKDCMDDEVCVEGYCSIESELEDDEDDNEEMPRFFFRLGGLIGAGFADSGMPADREPQRVNPNDPNFPYVEGGDLSCPGDVSYCVRVTTPGLVPTYGLRATVGYYVIPRLALALNFRYQFAAGQTDAVFPPPNFLFGARVQVLLTEPAATGFNIAAFVGGSYGELQIKPSQPSAVEEPYITSGPGGAQIGATLGYRFIRNFGLFYTTELMFHFPSFMINWDNYAGVEVAF